jgi:hypothetical protein
LGGPSADSVEQWQYFLRRTCNHRSLVPYNDRPLHEHRVLQQQVDHRLTGDIVRGLQTKLSKALVLTDQVGGGVRKQIEELLKVGTAWRVFEVFDNVELDVPLA